MAETEIQDPVEREFQSSFMQSAGPLTKPSRTVFFDIHEQPETPVVRPGEELPPEGAQINLQALVNPDAPDSCSLLGVRYAPNALIPRHKHDVAQIVLVVEGELRQGNRTFGVGQGYYTPPEGAYAVQAGPKGVKVLEFRPRWLRFSTDWV